MVVIRFPLGGRQPWLAPGWREQIQKLSQASGIDIHDYCSFIDALENRRAFFKQMGAKATDHAALEPFTGELTDREADRIFERALRGEGASAEQQRKFLEAWRTTASAAGATAPASG